MCPMFRILPKIVIYAVKDIHKLLSMFFIDVIYRVLPDAAERRLLQTDAFADDDADANEPAPLALDAAVAEAVEANQLKRGRMGD